MRYLVIVFLTFMLSSCSWINHKLGLQDDNFVEEVFEGTVEREFGVDIDFTPETPERKK